MSQSNPDELPVEVNEDGEISSNMAAQMAAIEARAKGEKGEKEDKDVTPEPPKPQPKIYFAGQPQRSGGPRTWLERRVLQARQARSPGHTSVDYHAEVRDLMQAIKGMPCPSHYCSAGRLTYSFHPKWYGLPMPYCRKCHREFDLIEIGVATEKELVERLKKMGVNAELDDGK